MINFELWEEKLNKLASSLAQKEPEEGKTRANGAMNYYFACPLSAKHYENVSLTKPIKHDIVFADTMKLIMGIMVSRLILLYGHISMKHYNEVLIT